MKLVYNTIWDDILSQGKNSNKAKMRIVVLDEKSKRKIGLMADIKNGKRGIFIELPHSSIKFSKLPKISSLNFEKKKNKLDDKVREYLYIESDGKDRAKLAEKCFDWLIQELKGVKGDANIFSKTICFLDEIKSFYSDFSTEISKEIAQGIFGELYFLNNYLLNKKGDEELIKYWLGPEKNKFDFELPDVFYEIKSKSQSSESIIVSNESQLDGGRNPLAKLFLVIYSVNGFRSDKNSIFEEVTSIKNKLSKSTKYLHLFDQILNQLKITKYNKEEYDYNFEISNTEYYKIGKDFPRIIRSNIPSKYITKVKYSINVAGIAGFKIKKMI